MPLRFHRWSCELAAWLGCLTLLAGRPASAASLTRTLPEHFTRGVSFEVVVEVSPGSSIRVYAVEEQVPLGWTVSRPSHGGVWDAVNGVLKWGPFIEHPALSRSLSYRVEPPAGAGAAGEWQGQGRFDGDGVATAGDDRVQRLPGELVRQMPADYVPGQPFVVTLTVRAAADVRVYVVEESVPAGWLVTTVSHGGEFDPVNRRVKWGPFLDEPPSVRDLSFLVTPPPDANGEVRFLGRALFDSAAVVQTGLLSRRRSQAVPALPVDYEPGVPVTLMLQLQPAPFVQVQTAELLLPVGWRVDLPSDGGVVDPVARKLKWGPFADAVPLSRALTARLIPPEDADGDVVIEGLAAFDRERAEFRVKTARYRLYAESAVLRDLPAEFEPGAPVTIDLAVQPRDGTQVYSVEDTLPEGWTLEELNAGGTFDAANRKVKWGPFFGSEATGRVLRYRAVPGLSAAPESRFEGRGWFGDVPRAVAGDSVCTAPVGWVGRTVPARYTPGVMLTVRLEAAPGPGTEVYAVQETLPEGWEFNGAVEGGVFDPLNRRIKWGPFADRSRRTLTYQATPPVDAAGLAPFAGIAVFNRSLLGVAGPTGAPVNRNPVAGSNTVQRVPGQAFKISAIQLLGNDTDPDGDFLRVTAVGEVSVHGAQVVLAWPWIYYTPTAGYDGPDAFAYAVGDGFGGVGASGVDIVVAAPPATAQNILSTAIRDDGSRQLLFGGIPGYTYHVEASVDLAVWLRLADCTASALGQFQFVDTEALSYPTRYYRSVWP